MTEIRRLAPGPALSDEDILALYARPGAAWLRANFVASADGAATHAGASAGLGTPADQRVFALLRRFGDVILVGAGTIRAEGYGGPLLDDAALAWRRDRGLGGHPPLAIVSGSLGLAPDAAVFTDAPARPLLCTTGSAAARLGARFAAVADVVACGADAVEAPALLAALAARGLGRVHCEGGPHLFGTLVAEGAVDELCVTVSPRLESGPAGRIAASEAAAPTGMRLAHALAAADGTLLLRYERVA